MMITCCDVDDFACDRAAESNHLDCLKALYEKGVRMDECTAATAAKHGSLECLVFIASKIGLKCSSITYNAALGGKYLCLRYAVQYGCEINKHTFIAAIKGENMANIQYLCDVECEWDEDVINFAAYDKSLKFFTYLLYRGCPCDYKECVSFAAQTDQWKIVAAIGKYKS